MRTFTLKFLTTFIFISWCTHAMAQHTYRVGDVIRFIMPVKHEQTNEQLSYATSNVVENMNGGLIANYLDPKVIFMIIGFEDDNVIVEALDFDEGEQILPPEVMKEMVSLSGVTIAFADYEQKEYDKDYKPLIYNAKQYKVKFSELNAKAIYVEQKQKWNLGIITLPFKYRPQGSGSFDTEFNMNSTLSWRYTSSSSAIDGYVQVGAGIGVTRLFSGNAPGVDDDSNPNVATLSFLFGGMFQFNRIQFGIYTGFDHINNQEKYRWKHQGNFWIGLGIGYDIFRVNLNAANKTQKNP